MAVFAVVEGTIASKSVELVPNVGPDEGSWVLATHYEMNVARSWKARTPAKVELWSFGGTLPDDVPFGDYPRGQWLSGEAYFEIGQSVVVTLAHSRMIGGQDLVRVCKVFCV